MAALSPMPKALRLQSELAKKTGVGQVIVTAGASGSAAVQRGEAFFQPSYFAKVVDSVGAGDAYLATFVTAQLEGMAMQDSLKRAAAAGALAVSARFRRLALSPGATSTSFWEPEKALASQRLHQILVALIEAAKNFVVPAINFSILHFGGEF